MGKGGTGTAEVDGKVVDSRPLTKSLPISLMWSETFNVGVDTGTLVDHNDCRVPFELTAKLVAKLKVDCPRLTPKNKKKIMEAQAKAADGAAGHLGEGAAPTAGRKGVDCLLGARAALWRNRSPATIGGETREMFCVSVSCHAVTAVNDPQFPTVGPRKLQFS
jgi:hypothetical protein